MPAVGSQAECVDVYFSDWIIFSFPAEAGAGREGVEDFARFT